MKFPSGCDLLTAVCLLNAAISVDCLCQIGKLYRHFLIMSFDHLLIIIAVHVAARRTELSI